MPNKLKHLLKEIAEQFAISFFFCCLLIVAIYFTCSNTFEKYINIINMMSVSETEASNLPVAFDIVSKRLERNPNYGTVWGTLKIESVGIDLPIYQGDDLKLLKKGVGHFAGSYFPGEGGSIIMPAHNTKKFFRHLPEVKVGDEIVIEATYGTFTYNVSKTEIIDYQDPSKLPVQEEHEVLMLYTCYPVNTVGLKTKRFVVFGELVGAEYAS